MSRRWAALGALLTGLFTLPAARPACAQAGADEVALSVEAGYVQFARFDGIGRGLDAQISASWGLSHGLSLGPQLRLDTVFADPARFVVGAEAPLTYTIDVLAIIPWVSLAPALSIDTAPTPALHAGVTASLGLDYRPRPDWSVGAAAEWSGFWPEPFGDGARLCATLRFTRYFSRVNYGR